MRLWAQIATTVALNLLMLAGLTAALVLQQSRSGLESFLHAEARDRARELGRQVEEEFPQLAPAERQAWLGALAKAQHVTLVIYDDRGERVAGPPLTLPGPVRREMERREAPRRRRPPMFLVKDDAYWIGYHFPLRREGGEPPVRYTLAVVADSLVDWRPWLVGAGVALLVTLACWLPLIRRFSRSLHAIQTASAEIAEGRFQVAIPVHGRDEFADVAHSVGRMARQLSRLIHGQQRFLADVAHELCAPLSRIQLSTGILEQTTAGAPALERLGRDVTHMSALVGDLLEFTKGTVREPELTALPLGTLVSEVIAREAVAGVEVRPEIPPELRVRADEEYLVRAVGNVLRNAIRYAGDAGPITITARAVADEVELVVEDHGPGLPEPELDAIFNPFYRPDTERTPGTGGAGLGLAIVKSCLAACGGQVSCRNRQPNGLAVIMRLKTAPA